MFVKPKHELGPTPAQRALAACQEPFCSQHLSIELPGSSAICAKREKIKIDVSSICNLAQRQDLANKNDIQAVVLFGSAANLRVVQLQKKFLGYTTQKQKIAYDKPPKDIDIFILTRNDVQKKDNRIKAPLYLTKLVSSGYNVWKDTRVLSESLDIFASSLKQLAEHLEQDNTVAQSIIEDGVLLAGEFPIQLYNKNTINWEIGEDGTIRGGTIKVNRVNSFLLLPPKPRLKLWDIF